MTRLRQGLLGILFARICFLGLATFGVVGAADTNKPPAAKPPALKLNAQLIWATNDEKSPDPSHKEVDASLRKRFQGPFKWKSYFEVSNQSVAAPLKQTIRVKLSSECEVEVTNHGDRQIEAKLFGKGEFQVRKKHMMKPGEIFSIAGDAKNGTAWFVVFTLADK